MTDFDSLFGAGSGKSPRQKEIEALYVHNGIDLEPVFWEALQKTLDNPTPIHFRGRGFMSHTMNGNILGLMKENYPDRMFQDKYKRWYFQLEKDVRVYLKKLDNKCKPHNIITKHVTELNCRYMLFAEVPTTILYAGFRLRDDEFWDDLNGCYLVEMKDLKRPNFISYLDELGSEINNRITADSIIAKADLPDEIIVTAKAKPKADELGETGSPQ